MTISSSTRKAGPFTGNGTATTFPFTFKVFQASDLLVVRLNTSTFVESTLVLNTDYTVALNQNQNTNPGGSIVLGSVLATGFTLTATSDIQNLQPTDLTNQGGFYPTVINDALDRATIQIQQIQEEVDRSLKYPISDPVTGAVLPPVGARASKVLAFDPTTGAPIAGPSIGDVATVVGNLADIHTVASDVANINIVADDKTNIDAVAANKANIDAVAGNATNINAVNANKAHIDAVATDLTNINAVAGDLTNINAVAGDLTNINAVKADLANIDVVATNVVDVNNFADVYQGAKASDPTLRNNGSALHAGDMYFNTSVNELRAYSGSVWVAGTAGTVAVQRFSGNGSTLGFTLSTAPSGENNTQVYINGVYQQKDTYDVTGTTLSFSSAPPSGTDNIEVVTISTLSIGQTDSSLVNYAPTGTGAVNRTVQSRLRDTFNVKDFGARGDGVGATPTSEGVSIMSASWNTWDNTPFKNNLPWSPFGTGGTFVPPRAKPFANDDTWDYIGCNLAMWEAARNNKAVYFPSGTYKMNASGSTSKGGYQGLLLMKGQEITMFGDGAYQTIITWKEDHTFFAANNYGTIGAYKLFEMYRTGGPPSNIRDMAFLGPDNYDALAKNITLINCENINGVTFRDIWLSTGWFGIHAETNSGDSHIKGCTAEFLFGSVVDTDASSDFSIDFCNFWASAVVPGQKGVTAAGRVSFTNSRLVEFYGAGLVAGSGVFANNLIYGVSISPCVQFTGPAVITGNQFSCGSNSSVLYVKNKATIVGNVFDNTSNHPCITAGDGAAGSATNLVISGNTFIQNNGAVEPQNYAITADQAGSNYTGAATASMVVTGNVFSGRALTAVGAATFTRNVFDGVAGPLSLTENLTVGGTLGVTGAVAHSSTVANNGAVTNNANVTSLADVFGKQVMNGTQTGSPFTVSITGVQGIGQGGSRDLQRLNLVSVLTNGSSHVARAFALFTSEYNGNAILIATLGASGVGGGITFGVSGANPTFTCTNSGGSVSYTVNAIPLV